jgi:hypothetical protein
MIAVCSGIVASGSGGGKGIERGSILKRVLKGNCARTEGAKWKEKGRGEVKCKESKSSAYCICVVKSATRKGAFAKRKLKIEY